MFDKKAPTLVDLVLLVMILVTPGKVLGDSTQSLSLKIDNQSDKAIRCTLIYAHFVSASTPVFTSAITLEFDRHASSGELSEPVSGKTMMLENILCGVDGAWQDTVTDMSLLPLRRSAADRFVARCVVSEPLLCLLSEE